MRRGSVEDLKLRYLAITHRATAGDENAKITLDIFHGLMEELITEKQVRVILDVWKMSGIKAAYTVYVSLIKRHPEGERAVSIATV
ncbi:hypothetical protein EDM54_01505 [Brevibacillus borstelensis]|uniref:hypothetical protein n=1 Tax=Brevibacillus borstelensis TaxID=45462 RepID=UPI00057C1F8E|nr:hypothetical protein [Brevibacillus borstelensis]MED1881092.1 hypothetical protein [Brevibacillus borstelensis]MED2006726.1 hypothetical protein [Brevibacillus borstelensis]RNB66376.1 hypothetical protein EDM54_01505 [Brevibacillus borstelensis]GED53511.1 hypothetical protein BBO01nite_27520 [Brevibacillus borstelensis]